MKKIALAVAAALMIPAAGMAETVKVGVAPEPYPPFVVPDAAGGWSGWEIDMIHAVCKAAEMDCEISYIAWDGLIPALNTNQIDAIFNSLSITEERQKVIDFSDKYYNTPAVIIAAKDSGITPDAEGLKGKILGVQTSTIHAAYAEKYFGDSVAEIKVYQTQDEANQDLVAGRIDATMADAIAMDGFLQSSDGQACCALMGAVKDDPAILGMGVGVGLRKGDEALKAKFNEGIAKILADGTYDEISKEYFASSIYGE